MTPGTTHPTPQSIAPFTVWRIVCLHCLLQLSFSLTNQRLQEEKSNCPETSLLSMEKLVDLGICRYNGLGLGEIVDDLLDDGRNEVVEAVEGRGNIEGVRRRPNMTFTNRLRAMDERLGDIETNILTLNIEVEDLTYVVSGMSEQYDQFYDEFGKMKLEQQRFQTWNTDHLS
ncbi:hypothetical protein Tco_0743375 [Tanacetum coccineum]